jgi:hypothetical protein
MKINDLVIIDEFLSEQDYRELSKLKVDCSKGLRVYHNRINRDNVVEINCFDRKLIERLHKNYHEKTIKILKKLCPEKLDLYDYSDFSIIVTPKNYIYPFHDDTPNKLLSGVIYLRPEKNSGTIFREDKKKNEKNYTVEWKKNRAVFFSRKEKETWHTYKGNGISDRIVLVYNLNTNRLKDVYKIERKNYILGSLRYKINPYLFRYFKFVI